MEEKPDEVEQIQKPKKPRSEKQIEAFNIEKKKKLRK